MFVVLQHPFADLRGFLANEAGRLARPNFPLMQTPDDFLRSTGGLERRRLGGSREWPGEDLYGMARRALKLRNHFARTPLGTQSLPLYPSYALRRFYSDGCSARLEVGVRVSPFPPKEWPDGPKAPDSPVPPLHLDSNTRDVLLQSVFKLEVSVPINDHGQTRRRRMPLGAAGRTLANHLLHVSTRREPDRAPSLQPWWFQPGTPSILCELDVDEGMDLPTFTEHIVFPDDAIASVSFAWVDIHGSQTGVWFLMRNPDARGSRKYQEEQIRLLRIHIMRLHSERECLRLILSSIRGGQLRLDEDADTSDAVQDYLNRQLALLERPEKFGYAQQQMLEVAKSAMGAAYEGQTASLQAIRRQVALKVDGYIRRQAKVATVINYHGDVMNITFGDNTTIQGDFTAVTAKNITDSFNKAANSKKNPQLQEQLQILAKQVGELSAKLPADKAEAVSKDLGILTNEALSQSPRKEWYDISSKGLLEAAKFVATFTKDIAKTLAAITTLLAL